MIPLALRIASLDVAERAQLWRALTATHKNHRGAGRGSRIRNLSQQVEELLAQIEFLHAEIETVQRHLRRR